MLASTLASASDFFAGPLLARSSAITHSLLDPVLAGLRSVSHPDLQLTGDLAEEARREKPRAEWAGRILTNGRQSSQGGSHRL